MKWRKGEEMMKTKWGDGEDKKRGKRKREGRRRRKRE